MVPQRAADLLFLQSLADELHESDEFAEVPAGTTASIFQQLAGRIDTSIHSRDLSAGQQLALVLALQLVKDAPVLILDEPTRGLDYAASEHWQNN
ncbi:MAG: ATP-binding cassette domain-containing protein [Actinobacteria bacterium]|nr:ATP-binding cassette domain-containing protein [Actinomycetota bacterium]